MRGRRRARRVGEMLIGMTGRGCSRTLVRAAAARDGHRQDGCSALPASRRSVFASVAFTAALSWLLSFSFTCRVEAYGIAAWTAAVHGAPSDPDAFPGPGLTQGSHAATSDSGGNF